MQPEYVEAIVGSMVPPQLKTGEVVARCICGVCKHHDPTTGICQSGKRCRRFNQFVAGDMAIFLAVIPAEVARVRR